jgi:hypothetical protein
MCSTVVLASVDGGDDSSSERCADTADAHAATIDNSGVWLEAFAPYSVLM